MAVQNLSSLSAGELKSFINGFDYVLSDCDGVILPVSGPPIPNTGDALTGLKSLGKDIKIVSNNCTKPFKYWQEQISAIGYEPKIEDLINPGCAIIDYLKDIDFKKQLFVVGPKSLKYELKTAGFSLAPSNDEILEETLASFISICKDYNEEVGGVVLDFNFNLTYSSLIKCGNYLSNPEVLFISGAEDKKLPIMGKRILGPGYFQDVLKSFTKRNPLRMGKPGDGLIKYLSKKLEVTDPSRILFVGDSLIEDISFANKAGYQSLLVMTGQTKHADLDNLNSECTPSYYLESLGDLYELLQKANL